MQLNVRLALFLTSIVGLLTPTFAFAPGGRALSLAKSQASSPFSSKPSTTTSSPFSSQQAKWTKQQSKTNFNNKLQMAVEGDFDPDALSRSVQEAQAGSIKARLRALYKFTRPHTIRGTILASFAGTIRALVDTPGSIANANWGVMLPRAVIGMVALLLGNAFIVGINQIFDEDIDRLNKPFLPVASGEMSKRFAWTAVLTGGIVGPLIV